MRCEKSAATDAVKKNNRRVILTSLTSGSMLSIHAISMQGVFIKFGKSSKSRAVVPNNARQPDKPCDSAH